ncbi:hypothetical protein ABIB85_004458 [Bradyrhizobium sp. JR1.5]
MTTVQPIDVATAHTCIGIGWPLAMKLAKRPLALDSDLLDPPQNVFEINVSRVRHNQTPDPPVKSKTIRRPMEQL